MAVKYDAVAKKILNVKILESNLDKSNFLIASDISTEAKNKYIPVISGKLRRSTVIGRAAQEILVQNTIEYAEFVWDHAKDFWRRQWFVKVVNVKRNIKRWEDLIINKWGK